MGLPIQPPKPGKAMSIFVLLVGLGILGVGAYSYVTDSAALNNRVEVSAEITDTSVEKAELRGRPSYVPVVTFQYEFRGRSYTSDRIYPGQSQPQYGDRANAQERISGYAVGQEVTAYLDPDTPGQAFLEDSRSGFATGGILVGAAIVLVGIIGLYQAQAQKRARDLLS